MKILKDFAQGTQEWHRERREKITGTTLEDVMGTPLKKLQRQASLIAEAGTEQTKQFRSTPEMERGSAEEPFAVRAFEERYQKKVERVGFCVSDEYPYLGWSPDGLIEIDGKYKEAIEVKNPDSATLIFYKLTSLSPEAVSASQRPFLGVPADYKWQVVDAFFVNEDLEKLYFAVYDARFISDQDKLVVVEVLRSAPEMQEALKEAKTALVAFREEWMINKARVLSDNF